MPRSSTTAGLPASPAGSAYLLCFGEPGLHVTGSRYARHYIGHTLDELPCVPPRDEADMHHGAIWLSGVAATNPLVAAAHAAGLSIELVRVWTDADAAYAARLRKGKRSPRLCPGCRPARPQAAQATR